LVIPNTRQSCTNPDENIEEKGKGVSGAPAIDAREHYRILASMKILPQLIQRVKELEKKLEHSEKEK